MTNSSGAFKDKLQKQLEDAVETYLKVQTAPCIDLDLEMCRCHS